jgi:hypothetical protein
MTEVSVTWAVAAMFVSIRSGEKFVMALQAVFTTTAHMHAPYLVRTLGFLLGAAFSASSFAAEFWVSPLGNDVNPGTRARPFATIDYAQRKARELRRLSPQAPEGGTHIVLEDGTYFLSTPLFFRAEDSGTETSPSCLEAAPGAKPVISAGQVLEDWQALRGKVPGLSSRIRQKLWVCAPPARGGQLIVPRQLWVNGVKAVRARTPNGDTLNRLLEWNVADQTAAIEVKAISEWGDLSRVEMIIHQQWAVAMLRVKSIRVLGPKAVLSFEQPESRVQFEHPWPAPIMDPVKGNAPYFLANAVEFIDEPGEWCQEMPSGRILYWPREGEDMTKASAFVPVLENVVLIAGTADRPVHHLQFKGITFSHSTYLRPSQAGHVPLQAAMAMIEAYTLNPNKGTPYKSDLCNLSWTARPSAAVRTTHARNLRFEGCRFERLGNSGLDFDTGTKDCAVVGNVFRDISLNGLQAGRFSDEATENHFPYNPSDDREVVSGLLIANNWVDDCGTDDWGSVGILVGFAREVAIDHNEVSNQPYTGISLGWGWTKAKSCLRDNRIHANYVHHVATRMCDTSGIYLLSAQPGTVVSENAVGDIKMSPYVFDPEHWFYLYLDEGSSYEQVRDNWCPEERFLANANGPDNVWERNGPQVPEKIRLAAGLEKEFQTLKK